MKIAITIPSFAVHGGIRIILEWANRLSKWHQVYLFTEKITHCNWFQINPNIIVTNAVPVVQKTDCLIISSPHHIHLQQLAWPQKKFIFMQMAEHMFRSDKEWLRQCKSFYTSPYALFSISRWNIEMLHNEFGRTAPTHYIGNGVNTNDFPVVTSALATDTVLVEGWESHNPTKDPDAIGPKVAAMLRAKGITILAYSAFPKKTLPNVPHEYYQKPSLQKLNELYQRATVLLKTTKYDARSCAPVEAMTKGTVTVRGIIKGDDDLTAENSVRCDYNKDKVFTETILLLYDHERRRKLSGNCIAHIRQYSWDHWMEIINNILCA